MTALTWTERSGSYRAEYRGQLAHVRHLRTGWSWTWGPWSAGGFRTAEAAMAAAETTLKQKEAT
jgi:hypothetical protein